MAEETRILITGASGFVGRHLCAELADGGASLLGCSDHGEPPPWAEEAGVVWALCDLTDARQIHEAVSQCRPDLIFHLAALSHVPTSFEQPADTWITNTLGTLHLLEAVRGTDCGLVFISSGDIYGRSFQPDGALDESALLQPANPYSASKAAADLMVQQYGINGLPAVCLRPLNHIGPGQRPDFVVASFARQIARIERGLQEPVITVGNLDAWRDFTDVRDIVRAYARVGARVRELESGAVFNVCSGRPRQIKSVLEELLTLSSVKIEVRVDPDRMRSSDTPYAAGDASRLRRAVGWEPEIAWEQTLRDVLDDWRGRVGTSPLPTPESSIQVRDGPLRKRRG